MIDLGSKAGRADQMTQAPIVTSLFETPLITSRVPDAERLNGVLRERIARQRSISAGVVRSNRLGWQSDTLMLRWGGEEARQLARHFIDLCESHSADRRPPAPNRKPFLWLLDMWTNVSPPGASNDFHTHAGAVWSAVYYLDAGLQGGTDEGGEIVFRDPRMPMTRMLPLDLRYRSPVGEVYEGEHQVTPATGTMLMFPPWLAHSVRPYRGAGERISIAMNATAYQPAD